MSALRYPSLVLLVITLFIQPGIVIAKPASAAQCKKIEEKIDRYTKLRQSGGSASQMDRWHRSRNKLKSQYTEKRCARFH